jgi:hypothetical protein
MTSTRSRAPPLHRDAVVGGVGRGVSQGDHTDEVMVMGTAEALNRCRCQGCSVSSFDA